ncbi:MAG TPA: response regulator, partial [Myxococcaceae bacterium]|nr:response regulator [Myxococcaceae bacterium]
MAEPRYTLLFVDDEPDVREILARTFEEQFDVLTAASAEEALAVLRQRSVDVLITDQKMPGMTGIELVAQAREERFDVTAILLTGYSQPEDLLAAINKGQVFRYVTKPWDLNDLKITVRNAVEVTQLRREKDRLIAALNKRVEALSILYEVSCRSAGDAATYDAIVDRVLESLERILPYDCAAALVAVDETRTATLRIRSVSGVSESALLQVKEQIVGAHLKHGGSPLPEDRIVTRVSGPVSSDARPGGFLSELEVMLTAEGRPVGAVILCAYRAGAYSSGDGELVDILA